MYTKITLANFITINSNINNTNLASLPPPGLLEFEETKFDMRVAWLNSLRAHWVDWIHSSVGCVKVSYNDHKYIFNH